MAALNGLQIDAPTARDVVKYLSNHHGLAPREARAAAFEVERAAPRLQYHGSADAEDTCNRCHFRGSCNLSAAHGTSGICLSRCTAAGTRSLITRRSAATGRRRANQDPECTRPPDTRQPVEKAIEHLAKAFPLITPEVDRLVGDDGRARLKGRGVSGN